MSDSLFSILLEKYKKIRKEGKTGSQESKWLVSEYQNHILKYYFQDDRITPAVFDAIFKELPSLKEIPQIDYATQLLYIGSLFSIRSIGEHEQQMQFRMDERLRALASIKLTTADLDSISSFVSSIFAPSKGLTHRASLGICTERVKKWLSASRECISEDTTTTCKYLTHISFAFVFILFLCI